jgi:hypothetical protein
LLDKKQGYLSTHLIVFYFLNYRSQMHNSFVAFSVTKVRTKM